MTTKHNPTSFEVELVPCNVERYHGTHFHTDLKYKCSRLSLCVPRRQPRARAELREQPLPIMEWPGQMDGDERKGYTGKGDTVLSAKEWAQLRLVWLASKRDVLRGYRERIDLTAILLRVAVILLAGYSIYLLYCESCKDEHYELYRHLLMAVSDAILGARGSISGTIVVLLCMVWLSTVLWMRQRPEVLLVDFQTYRHAAIDGGDAVNQAGEPVLYERFLAVSKAAVGVVHARTLEPSR